MSALIPASPTAEGAAPPLRTAGRTAVRRRLLPQLVRRPAGVAGLVITFAVLVVALFADVLAPYDPFAPIGPPLGPPSAAHPLGTDALGRDLLSGVIYGAQTSLLTAIGAGALVLVIGLLVGTVAGYRGGLLDDGLMRFTEVFQTLPRFFLVIMVIALWGPGLDHLVLAFGLTAWALVARVVRVEVLSLSQREFVEAARAGGASGTRITLREILPNALPVATVYLGLLLAQVILLEASLGFLGLGDPNLMSWGYLAGQAERFLRVAWWLSVFPGLAIMVTVLGLNFLNDALTDILGGRR